MHRDHHIAVILNSVFKIIFPLSFLVICQDAIEHNSYFLMKNSIKSGNVDEGFESCDHILEGEIKTGAQEHFYLETFTTLVIPGEGGEIEVTSSSQSLTTTQVGTCSN